MSKKDIIPKHQRDVIASNEIGSNQECLRQPFRFGLYCIAKADATLGTIAEETDKLRLILGRCDNENLANSRKH